MQNSEPSIQHSLGTLYAILPLTPGRTMPPGSPFFARHALTMKKSVYIGNLPFSATETELHDLFTPFTPVYGVKIIMDRETQRSRGFAFVEVDADKAEAAIKGLEGKDMKGRPLKVNEARHRVKAGAA